MKKILDKIGKVLEVILLAPVKLPIKVLNIAKYITLGLGIAESVLEKDKGESTAEKTVDSADELDKNTPAEGLGKEKKVVKKIRKKGETDALE